MSTITVTDELGLSITTTPNASSALSKYLKDPATILANLGTVSLTVRNAGVSSGVRRVDAARRSARATVADGGALPPCAWSMA